MCIRDRVITALLVLSAVWRSDETHRAVGLCLLLWWVLYVLAQHITGLYSHVFIGFFITALVAHFMRVIGRASGREWPYVVFAMMICAMALHLSYWALSRHIDITEIQFEYQSADALIFYLCQGWLLFHDRKIRRVSKFS